LKEENYLESNEIKKRASNFFKAWRLRNEVHDKYFSILESLINNEFGGQTEVFSSTDSNSLIKLYNIDKNFEISSTFPLSLENMGYENKGFIPNDVFYMETPYIFDFRI